MYVLVTYDVCTLTSEGRRRLRRVAQVCLNYGQRVQLSVFECAVGETDLARLRQDLLKEINPEEDSLRLYLLGDDPGRRVEHFGQKPTINFEDPLVL